MGVVMRESQEEKKRRLAESLRDNLRRRKVQSRAQSGTESNVGNDDAPGGQQQRSALPSDEPTGD